jgi:hypothetical protein
MQKMDPLPTWPSPLQILTGSLELQSISSFAPGYARLPRQVFKNTGAHARQFLRPRFSAHKINEIRTTYRDLLGDPTSRVVEDTCLRLLNEEMRLHFKTDAQFVHFLRLLYHRPREAVKTLDGLDLKYLMRLSASGFATKEKQRPAFILTVITVIRNTALDNLHADRHSIGANWTPQQRRSRDTPRAIYPIFENYLNATPQNDLYYS